MLPGGRRRTDARFVDSWCAEVYNGLPIRDGGGC